MSLIDRGLARIGYYKASQLRPPVWLAEGGTSFQIPDGHLAKTQSELYQRLSWVHIAVSMTAKLAAATPLKIKQRAGEDANDIDNHPFELLLQQPNPLQSRFEFLMATYAYHKLTGNAYWWLNRTSADEAPVEMWLIPSHMIKPVPDGKLFLKGYLYDPGIGKPAIPLETYEIAHFKEFHPLNPYVGLSPIEALATIAIGDMKMAEWNTNYFGKDNAKVPGFLAYADNINDFDWGRMKADAKEQSGGTKRRLNMLRNVGPGGVQWIATSLSQKDMEFLSARTFNKEEIFTTFAPGMASMLAVNATEANSRTGKATLMEAAIWPMLVSVGEKITSDILPAYGDKLLAAFDDVRLSDRAMELQEQTAFGVVHTLDEIRQKFYQSKPIGDDRGKLLPAEVGKTALGGEEDPPPPPQLAPFAGQITPEEQKQLPPPKEDETGEKEDAEKENAGQMKAELKKWQTFVIHRVKAGKAMREFVTDAVPPTLKAAIEGALDGVQTPGDVARVFANAIAWQGYP